MDTPPVVCGQEFDAWLGYLAHHPEYCTQGKTLDDLPARLMDLFADIPQIVRLCPPAAQSHPPKEPD
ncbi:MAG: hypothetical protein SFV23_07045 [Planctomycetaceae bacterium]|nr:hypothetical protein [Planctomycetaceae bacterium]